MHDQAREILDRGRASTRPPIILSDPTMHRLPQSDPDAHHPEVVTLCGSMRLLDLILHVAARETLAGNIVLAPFAVIPADDQDTAVKASLDELHRRKIDRADRVVVVTDPTAYIGESTRAEIAYAAQRGTSVDLVAVLDTPDPAAARTVVQIEAAIGPHNADRPTVWAHELQAACAALITATTTVDLTGQIDEHPVQTDWTETLRPAGPVLSNPSRAGQPSPSDTGQVHRPEPDPPIRETAPAAVQPNSHTTAPPHRDSMESPSPATALYAHRDTPTAQLHGRDAGIDTWFGLSDANYLVVPRTLLQSMPASWQHRIVSCLRELDDAFDHLDRADDYAVRAVQWRCAADLTAAELAAAEVTTENDHPSVEGGAVTYFHAGHEIDPHDTVIAVPTPDPIPHYDRGRTLLPRTTRLND